MSASHSPPPVRRAFVLGAGLGTRLRPLTHCRPKPLVPVANKPLITFAFDRLLAAGIDRLVVNTHRRAEVFARLFANAHYGSAELLFRHEPELLETGGGIANVADLMGDEPFVVYNGDVLATMPLAPAIAHHLAQRNEITLLLRPTGGPLQIRFDPGAGTILDIGSRLAPGTPGTHLFTGIYVVSPAFARRIAPGTKISVIPIFLDMIRAGARLGGYVEDGGQWWDVGSRDRYLAVHATLAAGRGPLPGIAAAPWVAPDAAIAASARLAGATAVGRGATVGEGAVLEDCVVWDGAVVAPGSRLCRCVVGDGARVAGALADADLLAP